MDSWDGGHEASRGILTPVHFNARGCFKPNTVSPRHQRESLLRLSPEFILVALRVRPDDHLEVRTPIEETVKQPIDLVPTLLAVGVERYSGRLKQGTTHVEDELRESERRDSRKTFPEGYHGQGGQVRRWDMGYNGSEGSVSLEPEAAQFGPS